MPSFNELIKDDIHKLVEKIVEQEHKSIMATENLRFYYPRKDRSKKDREKYAKALNKSVNERRKLYELVNKLNKLLDPINSVSSFQKTASDN